VYTVHIPSAAAGAAPTYVLTQTDQDMFDGMSLLNLQDTRLTGSSYIAAGDQEDELMVTNELRNGEN
jgi:hypothetical protein